MMSKCEIDGDGNKRWYIDGKYHRENGPAMEFISGYKAWIFDGKYHREDGPAVLYANGDKCWYFNDKLHREDGPAIEHSNGTKEWYLKGRRILCSSTKEFLDQFMIIDGEIYLKMI